MWLSEPVNTTSSSMLVPLAMALTFSTLALPLWGLDHASVETAKDSCRHQQQNIKCQQVILVPTTNWMLSVGLGWVQTCSVSHLCTRLRSVSYSLSSCVVENALREGRCGHVGSQAKDHGLCIWVVKQRQGQGTSYQEGEHQLLQLLNLLA